LILAIPLLAVIFFFVLFSKQFKTEETLKTKKSGYILFSQHVDPAPGPTMNKENRFSTGITELKIR
jgi:hypothetical protein